MLADEMARSLEEAKADLTLVQDRLWTLVADAVDELYERRKDELHLFSIRTRRTMVHDAMVRNAREFEAEEPAARVVVDGLLITLIYENRYRFRLKYHDDRLRTHNIPTQQVLEYQDQEGPTQLPLPLAVEPVTNLNLGYQMNLTDTAATGIWITCPDGDRNAWAWMLDRPAASGVATILPAGEPDGGQPIRRVRARPDAAASGASSSPGDSAP